MSSGPSCNCPERDKPASDRNWIVYKRYYHRSAFSGYHYTISDYSSLWCRCCGAVWRSKAKYVSQIPDGDLT